MADTVDWPWLDQTADFAYGRLQGPPGGDHYDAAGLDQWAARAKALAEGKPVAGETIVPAAAKQPPRDVFAYFVSMDKGNAPSNAMAIQQRLGISPHSD